MKTLVFFIGIICCANQLFAQTSTIITDRPDITESAAVVPTGWLQGEHGFSYSDDYYHTFEIASTLMRLGLNEHTEFRIGFSPTLNELPEHDSSAYQLMQGFDFGVKSMFYAGNKLNAATIVSLGTNYYNTDNLENLQPYFSILFAVSYDLFDFWSIGLNTGADWNEEENYLQFPYSVSNAFSLGDKMGYFVELFGPDFTENELSMDAGFTYLISDNFQVDISGGFHFDNETTFISTGFAYRFDL